MQTNPTLSQAAQQRYDAIREEADTEEMWIVEIDPIHNHLDGNQLTINLPDASGSYDFFARNVVAKSENQYLWTGHGDDGSSSIEIARYPAGYAGFVQIPEQNRYYSIIALSTNEVLMVRHNGAMMQNMGCAITGDEPDDDDDNEADKRNCSNPFHVIRVLVLFTANANLVGNPQTVAPTIIDQLNIASVNSAISPGDMSFELAGVEELVGFDESPEISDDLSDLRNNQNAQDARDAAFADLVILLTNGNYDGVVGLARLKAANANAYAIAEIANAAGTRTGAHETGHLMGARHQKGYVCTDGDDNNNYSSAHGFLYQELGNNRRTILTVQACPGVRVLRWSNPDVFSIDGNPTGAFDSNVALNILNRSPKVSCFRDNPLPTPFVPDPPILTVDGPVVISDANKPFQWTASVLGNPPQPVSYVWEITPNGINNWTQVETGNSYSIPSTIHIPLSPTPCWFTLRVTATDANGGTNSFALNVNVFPC